MNEMAELALLQNYTRRREKGPFTFSSITPASELLLLFLVLSSTTTPSALYSSR